MSVSFVRQLSAVTVQQIDSTVFVSRIILRTMLELQARRLSKIHSTVDLYSTTSALKVSRNLPPPRVWTWPRQTVANRWKQVNTAGKLGRRIGGDVAGYGNAAAVRSLCVHRYKQWLVRIHMQTCKSTTSLQGHYVKNSTVSKGRRAYHHIVYTLKLLRL